ncbi:MAG TPA: DUF4350 domain-containing protein [Verrucomicrobiae bacterium]|nr:DUF4350 domain-containing protein [Verrucomicrobiae bacterium]
MKRFLPILFIVLCVAAFVVGLLQLFRWRFEAGDVYPPYSSLRADPLGTMALYESLEELPGLTVRRDYSDANKLPETPNTTYLHLGAKDYEWQELPVELFDEIESFARRGGRLAIALAPVTSSNRFLFSTVTVTNAAGTNAAARKRVRKILEEDGPRVRSVSIQERWGLSFDFQGLVQGEDEVYQPVQVTNATALRLPPELDWHSGLVVTNHDARWRVVYSRGAKAVVVERQFGTGTVVMATDSYFLSNEAMWVSRHPEFLAWFVGPAKQAIFDEGHLGVMETSGVAVLMRKYRLYGVIGALVVLAGLFVWKNTVSLVPPHAMEVRRDYVIGKDAAGGFVNLLRRNIPAEKILEVCFEEWTKSLTRATRHTIASVDRASEIMETRQGGDSVDAYQRIAKALKSSRSQVSSSRSEAATQTQTTNEH